MRSLGLMEERPALVTLRQWPTAMMSRGASPRQQEVHFDAIMVKAG